MTRLLVCPPTYFGVEYVINPWMAGNVGEASQTTAMRQWDALVSILEDHADVYGAEPQPGLPDMCFAANGGLVLDETFVPATFSVAQREPESGLYRAWAEAAGFEAAEADDALAFEGEGDALWWPAEGNSKPVLWAGYGVRTSLEAHRMLTETTTRRGGVAAAGRPAVLSPRHLLRAVAGGARDLLPAGVRRAVKTTDRIPRTPGSTGRGRRRRRLRICVQRGSARQHLDHQPCHGRTPQGTRRMGLRRRSRPRWRSSSRRAGRRNA